MTCPHCGEPIAAGDAFCEACGTDLGAVAGTAPAPTPAAAGAAHDDAITAPSPPPSAATPEQPRTHLLQPGGGSGVDTSLPCAACGAEVADDGFCTVCGHRARTRREHWTETHGRAGAPSIGAVCDKGISHARNEDAMATALTAVRARRRRRVRRRDHGTRQRPGEPRRLRVGTRRARRRTRVVRRVRGAAQCLGAGARRIVPGGERRGGGDRPHARRPAGAAVVHVRRRRRRRRPDRDRVVRRLPCLLAARRSDDAGARPGGAAGDGEQLTLDHSLGTEMIRGGMTREQAEADPTCHTITTMARRRFRRPDPRVPCVAGGAGGLVARVQRRDVELRIGRGRSRGPRRTGRRRRCRHADGDRRVAGGVRQRAGRPRQHHGGPRPL